MKTIPKDETPSKAYSRDDIRRFKRGVLLDALRLRQEVASMPADHISQDHIILEHIGLERYMSPTLLWLTAESKHAHAAAVLGEQNSQDQVGICDEERLSLVSQASSSWARGVAFQRANN